MGEGIILIFFTWMEIKFFCSFLNRKATWVQTFLYILLMNQILFLEGKLQGNQMIFSLLELLFLAVFGRFMLGCNIKDSIPAAALTIAVIYLGNGIFNPVIDSVIPWSVHFPDGLIPVLSGVINGAALLMIAAAYTAILKNVKQRQEQTGYLPMILFFPIVLILVTTNFISDILYGNIIEIIPGLEISHYPIKDNITPFFIYMTACLCLAAVLYTYRKAMDGIGAAIEVKAMKQQISMQQEYMDEAAFRYHQTSSFRHDMKNHMLVLEGMIKQNHCQQALEYLQKLKNTSDSLSFPCSTGMPVLDILLSNKLALAKQKKIQIQCSLAFPKNFTIEDIDLCIIFANAIDNAIAAANQPDEKSRWLIIDGKRKGNFYLVEISNSCLPVKDGISEGIGIKNIKQAVHKYQGILKLEMADQSFCLSILFQIPN